MALIFLHNSFFALRFCPWVNGNVIDVAQQPGWMSSTITSLGIPAFNTANSRDFWPNPAVPVECACRERPKHAAWSFPRDERPRQRLKVPRVASPTCLFSSPPRASPRAPSPPMRTPLSILQDALLARQKALSEYEELDDVHEADRAALGEKEGRLPERAIGGLGSISSTHQIEERVIYRLVCLDGEESLYLGRKAGNWPAARMPTDDAALRDSAVALLLFCRVGGGL